MTELSLEVVEGPDSGRRVPLSGEVPIGREGQGGLILRDDLVSRRHARVTASAERVIVEDLGSRNGTFVNGNQIVGPTAVEPGDQILVGVSVVELRSERQIAERPSAARPVPPGLAAPERRPEYLPSDLRAVAPQRPPAPAPGAPVSARAPGGPAPPAAPVGRPPEAPVPALDPLLDVNVKRRAFLAPLAILVVAGLAVMIFLATR